MTPGYDFWHQAISALSLGPQGWIQILSFVLLGVAIITTVPVWRIILANGSGRSAYPIITLIQGLTFIVISFVPQDPAPGYDPEELHLTAPTLTGLIHLALAAIASGCSVTNLFIMATRFAGDPACQGWQKYTRLMAVLMIIAVAVYAVWSTESNRFAGTFERLAMIISLIWTFTFLRCLSLGIPFMVTKRGDR